MLAAVVFACPQTRPGTDAGSACAVDGVLVVLPPQPAANAQHSSSRTIAERPTAYPSSAPTAPLALPPGISSAAVSGLSAERVALAISASLTCCG